MLFVVVLLLLCVQNIAGAITINQVVPVASTTSDTRISILGTGFDSIWPVTNIRISGISCLTPAKESDTTITCLAQPGLGSGNQLLLEWGGDQNHTANVVNFVAASNVGACTRITNLVISAASAAVPVTICGSSFGEGFDTTEVPGYTGIMKVSVPLLATDNVGTIISHHDNQLIVTFPGLKGVGQFLAVAVTLGTQTVVVDRFTISFPPPIIGAATIEDLTKRRLTGKRIGISGSGFGTPGPNVKIIINVGPFACAPVTHTSDSQVSCIVMGEGSNYELEVIVNGQSSLVRTSAYSTYPSVRMDFLDTATPGNSICTPPFGTPDLFNNEYCNCWSGYAPSNNLHTDCDLHPACPAKVLSLSVVSPFAPNRPKFEFKDDKLFVRQTIPIVKNRRDTIIQFAAPHFQNQAETNPLADAGVIGSPQCSYPGILWEKHIDTLDCVEEFRAVLPWSQQQFCGFIEHTSASILASGKREYKANLVTTYFETFIKKNGKLAMRKMSTAYLVKVSFARRVALYTSTLTTFIADEQSASSLSVEVSSDLLYDVASKSTIITFTTTAVWPYELSTPLYGTWRKALTNTEGGYVDVDITLATPQPGELVCAQVQDTVCEQSWIMVLEAPDVCNLRGEIAIASYELECRDYEVVDKCHGSPSLNFTINIGDTDLCASNTSSADASKDLTATLDSYYTQDHSISQNIFQLGDTVFFRLVIRDPTSTIDQITFKKIWIFRSTDTNVENVLYEVDNAGDLPSEASTNLVDAKFNVTRELRESLLVPGDEAILSFEFRLDRLYLSAVNALALDTTDPTKSLGVEAVIDIAYHGNSKKRTLTASTTTAGNFPTSAHHYISFYAEELEELADNENVNNAEDEESWKYDGELMLFGESAASTVAVMPFFTLLVVFISFVVLA